MQVEKMAARAVRARKFFILSFSLDTVMVTTNWQTDETENADST
jgi:hypothetical protein